MNNAIYQDTTQKMEASLESLKKELSHVRTGQASISILDPVKVNYYGTSTPLNQVAKISCPDAKSITVTPWEKNILGDIEKAIVVANLGFTPINDGKLIRINIPPLTEERRKEIAKQVKKMGEEAKIAVRNIRRISNDTFKKMEKDKEISKDDLERGEGEIQKITDTYIAKIDDLVEKKSQSVLTI